MASRRNKKNVSKEIKELIKIQLKDDENIPIKTIAKNFNLSRRTISKIRRELENETDGIIAPETPSNEIPRVIVNRPEDQVIKNIVIRRNDVTLKEIAEELALETGCIRSISCISKKLKSMQITRKRLTLVPVERNAMPKKEIRATYAMNVSVYSTENMVFLDETGFNAHTTRRYGYSLVGTKSYRVVPANRGQNLSCMCVISLNGLVAYDFKRGAYNSESFVEFIQNYLVDYFRANPRKVLIMDNCRFHHSRDVQRVCSDSGISVIFLPPYSPQLNPIEEFFSMIKARFTALRESNTAIEPDLCTILDSDFSEDCMGFYLNMQRWMEKARRFEDFI
jgi:transposase